MIEFILNALSTTGVFIVQHPVLASFIGIIIIIGIGLLIRRLKFH